MIQNTPSSSNLGISQISEGAAGSTNTLDGDSGTQQFEESFIFPLFSEISRVSHMPSILCFIQLIIQIAQSLIANIFIGNLHLWDTISSTPKIIRYLSYIINVGLVDLINDSNSENVDNFKSENFYNCWPIYFAILIFILIEILFVTILLIYYRKKRLFLNWTLHLANFLFSFINIIIYAPTCGIFGYAVWQVDLYQTSESIIYLILSIISVLFLSLIIIYHTNFTCNSIYLSRSIDSCWDPKVRNFFTITIGLSSFLSPFLNPFSGWFIFVGFLIVLLFNAYQLYLLHYLPYLKEFMNSVIQSSCVLSIVDVVLSIAHSFVEINSNVLIFVPIGIFVISLIIYYFFDKYRIKKILDIMDSTSESNSDEKRKEFLNSIQTESDEKIIFYIHIGIKYMSPICVDYSIMKYISSIRQTQKVMFALIHITAMIPAQIQFLSVVVQAVSTNEARFTITQKYILYQARKVNVTRQSVSSKEERADAKILYKMSEETISLVRGFWSEIFHLKSGISTASLRYFRNAANRTSSSYLDAIEQYPRSQHIYDQYVRFLIEAKGDFKGSIQYRKNLMMIEKGQKIVHDYAFRSFANAFPKYLTEKIFDKQGMYIDKNIQTQSNDNNSTANSTQNSTSVASTKTSDSYRDDEISSTIFDHSKLRLALQDVIDRSSMSSLNSLRAFSVVTFILVFLIMIILLVVISSTSQNVHDLVRSISLTSKMLTSIQYSCLIVVSQKFQSSVRYNFKEDFGDKTEYLGFYSLAISKILSIDNTSLPQEPSIYYEPYVKLNREVEQVRSNLQEEMEILFSNPTLHESEIFLFGDLSESNHEAFYTNSEITNINIKLSASLRGIINMVIRQIEFISSLNLTLTEDVLYNDLKYVITSVNCLSISKGFDAVFFNISQTGIDNCERNSNIYDVLTYVLSIVAVVIFFIIRLINFLYVIKDFRNLSSLLQGFTKDDLALSSKPIYLLSKESLPTGTVHSAHDFSPEVFILPFLFFLIAADCVFFVVYSTTQTQSYFDTFANVFEWAYGGAQRASFIMTLANIIHIDYIYFEGKVIENKTEYIQKILNYQSLIDMQIIGKDSRFDEYYYFDKCGNFNGNFDFADFADCLSVSNKIYSEINMFIDLNNQELSRDELSKRFEYCSMMYNIDKSIYKDLISFMDYLISFSEKISNENNNGIRNICIVGIIILIALFILENIFISMLYNSLEGFKQLIYTLPPVSACRNRSLMLFLSNKKLKEDLLTTSDLILESSQFSIVTINENFIIQTINQEFCKLTEYSSQKLLGQSITYLIPLPNDGNGKISIEKSPFYSAINEMRNKTTENDSYSVKVKIRKEDLSFIHMNASLIKLTDSSNDFKGVTLLLKNSEENIELKNKLEQEKMNVNNLIQVLIPRGALNLVKGKKQSAFFKADEASLIFVEIAGMSDCISMMSPKGILDILQQFYNGIDRALKKFKTISMIRWENEMIFAVSGLFDNVGDFKKQAFETAAFLIEILQNLDDTNIQANTDFHLRLGAHIGGPVMGFIQDPNNPCFDILSSSFKFLNFMKENGPLDRPQLTNSLIRHLDENNFDIKKESTFVLDDINEEIFSVQFKEGYKLPDEYIIDDDLNNLGMIEEDVKIADDEDAKSITLEDGENENDNLDENTPGHAVEPEAIENDDEKENSNDILPEHAVEPEVIENDDEKENSNDILPEHAVEPEVIENEILPGHHIEPEAIENDDIENDNLNEIDPGNIVELDLIDNDNNAEEDENIFDNV